MMYKGESDAAALLTASQSEGLDAVTIGYGVANWHLYNGRKEEARRILEQIVETNATQWASFGYLASEAEVARMR